MNITYKLKRLRDEMMTFKRYIEAFNSEYQLNLELNNLTNSELIISFQKELANRGIRCIIVSSMSSTSFLKRAPKHLNVSENCNNTSAAIFSMEYNKNYKKAFEEFREEFEACIMLDSMWRGLSLLVLDVIKDFEECAKYKWLSEVWTKYNLLQKLHSITGLQRELEDENTNSISKHSNNYFTKSQIFLLMQDIGMVDLIYNRIKMPGKRNKLLAAILQCNNDTAKKLLNGYYTHKPSDDKVKEVNIFISKII